MTAELFQLGTLPKILREPAYEEAVPFVTMFYVDLVAAGSGTFVRVAGRAGILTARHVWENIQKLAAPNKEVGILISKDRHRFVIPYSHLTPRLSIRRRTNQWGPDVEFIELPMTDVAVIESKKSFYSLDTNRAKKLRNASNSQGYLIAIGFPQALETRTRDNRFKVPVVTQFCLGMMVGRNDYRNRGRFDHMLMRTQIDSSTPPSDYRGVSGGSVWKVILKKKKSDPIQNATIENIYLAGVIYYQTAIRKNWRSLRAHGPRTIYNVVRSKFHITPKRTFPGGRE